MAARGYAGSPRRASFRRLRLRRAEGALLGDLLRERERALLRRLDGERARCSDLLRRSSRAGLLWPAAAGLRPLHAGPRDPLACEAAAGRCRGGPSRLPPARRAGGGQAGWVGRPAT